MSLHTVSTFINILFPPRCLHCQAIVGEHSGLCGQCWARLSFIMPPQCVCCGMPFHFTLGTHITCSRCLQKPPPFKHARSLLRYTTIAKKIIHKFKYEDHPHFASFFARWLVKRFAHYIQEHDMLIPVPLHPWRLLQRRYNQASLLADYIHLATGVPCYSHLLKRTQHTAQQMTLPYQQRIENVRHAFMLPASSAPLVRGKKVLLIDDVMTTGATVQACTKTLLKAEVSAVGVLTLARTTLDD